MTPADKQEPVACPECGHLAGEESDLLTIAYMSGAYDERKARENGLRPTSDLAERIEGLVEQGRKEVAMLREIAASEARGKDWNANLTASADCFAAILAALKEVNSHDRT